MAIQISPKLLTEIAAHIDEMGKTAIRAQFGSENNTIPFYICGEDAAIMDQIVWGEYLHLRDQIPAKWLEDISTSGVCNQYSPSIEAELKDYPILKDHFELRLMTEGKTYLATPNFKHWRYKLVLDPKTVTGPLASLYAKLKERAEVACRWISTKHKVEEFLKTCRSLNQAVKLWPELVNFLPTERRKRLEEENKPKTKKERTTPAPEEVLGQINRDAIAGDLVALRFATN